MAFWNILESEPCLSAAFLTAPQFPQSAFIPDVPHHSLCPATATSSRNNGATFLSPRMRWLCCASSANKRRAVLGIDVGTSATKAALCFIDQNGRLGPISRVAHETLSYGNQQVTQRVSDWFGAALRTGREALANAQEDEHIVAISVTGQMQDLIAVGPSPPALLRTEAVLYSDARAQAAAASLSAQLGERVDATGILPKLTLLPPLTQQAMASYKLLLGAADYVVHKFCKEKPTVTDATTVSTTGLTRGAHREYDSEMLRLAGLGHFETLLPDILARPQVVGRVSKLVAEELGRGEMEGIPVVHAGGDAFSATVGAGREGRGGGLYVYCGSSGWVGGSVERKGLKEVEDGVFRLGHAGDERLEVRVGSVGAAGVNVSFAGATLLGGVDAGEVCRLARGAAVGAGGLSYVPYLEGRRCPRPSVGMRGGLVGMTGGVGREEVARAVVEGVVFALAEAGGGGAGRGVRMVGGGVECEVLVRGIAALVGGGEVEVGSEAKGVGIVGAGRTAKEVVDGEAGEEWWSTEKVVRVGEEEMGRWVEAFAQWRRSVQVMEGLL